MGLKADVRKVQPPPPVPAPTMQSQRARPWARLARGGAVRMRLAVASGMGSDGDGFQVGRDCTSGLSASMSVHASQAKKTSRVTDGVPTKALMARHTVST